MRGLLPSLGVAKFALLVPPPSCASALTESLPAPPLSWLSLHYNESDNFQPAGLQTDFFNMIYLHQLVTEKQNYL